ncbi:hypothetical protein DXT99_26610 [Pontibacter diazotrophicus]|uniref:Copper chaperone n=1 Tax=Pontibacter diazotrophicus TaxID=1400979 RepID=A0A3D8KYV7_9BACT|nr:hypothetical protein [Pontibacter diazotrophicus]RDV10255.1 hypothetical protein DXT99_26610 [Pontibacter diazotrophicus]
METVLVFKTSVTTNRSVSKVKPLLDRLMDKHEKWSFDLEDCDHILRVEAVSVQPAAIIERLGDAGFACAELED